MPAPVLLSQNQRDTSTKICKAMAMEDAVSRGRQLDASAHTGRDRRGARPQRHDEAEPVRGRAAGRACRGRRCTAGSPPSGICSTRSSSGSGSSTNAPSPRRPRACPRRKARRRAASHRRVPAVLSRLAHDRHRTCAGHQAAVAGHSADAGTAGAPRDRGRMPRWRSRRPCAWRFRTIWCAATTTTSSWPSFATRRA